MSAAPVNSDAATSLHDLFRAIETSFPADTLGRGKWYILALSALVAGGKPEAAPALYGYLVQGPDDADADADADAEADATTTTTAGSQLQSGGEEACNSNSSSDSSNSGNSSGCGGSSGRTPAQRQALVRRLREALLKLVSIVGVPRPLEAVYQIAAVERAEDREYSFSREHWKSGPENIKRGNEWLAEIYRQNLVKDFDKKTGPLNAHRDFEWVTREITYGLYLSDHSILGPVETELVVLAGIMMQNLERETGWHLRGMRRIGVSAEDVEAVQLCIEKVAAYCGLTLDKVPRVKDIEHEV